MNFKAYVAEFIGTFALIFVGVGAITADYISGACGLVGIALAHGLTIAVMASATAAVSGASSTRSSGRKRNDSCTRFSSAAVSSVEPPQEPPSRRTTSCAETLSETAR